MWSHKTGSHRGQVVARPVLTISKGSDEKFNDIIFSIISLYIWDFFQTLKGSQLYSPWLDLAEFRTHSSSYVYHHNLQV